MRFGQEVQALPRRPHHRPPLNSDLARTNDGADPTRRSGFNSPGERPRSASNATVHLLRSSDHLHPTHDRSGYVSEVVLRLAPATPSDTARWFAVAQNTAAASATMVPDPGLTQAKVTAHRLEGTAQPNASPNRFTDLGCSDGMSSCHSEVTAGTGAQSMPGGGIGHDPPAVRQVSSSSVVRRWPPPRQ